MNTFKKSLLVLATALALSSIASGQAITPNTTFSVAVGYGDQSVQVSNTSVTTGGIAYTMTGLNQGSFQTILFVDREAIGVMSLNGKVLSVQRGLDGTKQAAHSTSATVWFGPPTFFSINVTEPSGTCTAANEIALPRFFENFGTGWTCPTAGVNKSQWTLQYGNPVTYLPADSSLFGTVSSSVCHITYSVANDGGAVGLITPANNCTIPKNAVIWQAYSVMTVAPVGSTGNVSVGLSAGGGTATSLLAATARGSLTVGTIWQGPPVQTTASASNTSYLLLTAAAQVTITVATNALTAGQIDCYVFYTLLPA